MRRLIQSLALILVLGCAGAVLGRLASPALSRAHYIVKVAEKLWAEEAQGIEAQAFETIAMERNGIKPELVYAQAREIRDRFLIGGTWFGLWCGLIVALRIIAILREKNPREYEPDAADCLACCRCFWSCPVEREKHGEIRSP